MASVSDALCSPLLHYDRALPDRPGGLRDRLTQDAVLPLPGCCLCTSLCRYPFGASNPAFLICGDCSSSSIDAAALSTKVAKRLPDFCFSASSRLSSSSSDAGSALEQHGSDGSGGDGSAGGNSGSGGRRRTPGPDVCLGLALDKQLCFYGFTSVAVLGGVPGGLQLALAALTVAMRETHRWVVGLMGLTL